VPLTIRRVLAEVSYPERPSTTITLTDQSTGTVLGSVLLDAAGLGVVPLPYELLLAGVAAGHGAGVGTPVPGAQSGGAGGHAGGAGTLAQAQPLAGAAGGHAAGAASETTGIAGAAAGHAAGAGAPTVVLPGSNTAGGGGQGGAGGTLSQTVPLGGSAGGSGGAGPSPASQVKQVAGAAGGQGGAAATAGTAPALGGGAGGAAAGAGSLSLEEPVSGSSPTFVAAGTMSLNPTIPAEAVDDDILVLVVPIASQSTPAGWTKKTTNTSSCSVFWRRKAGAVTAPSLTVSYGRIAVVRGCVATGDPFDDFANSDGAGSTRTIAGITTTVTNTLILFAVGGSSTGTGASVALATPPSGPALTPAFVNGNSYQVTSQAHGFGLWYGAKGAAGVTASESATGTFVGTIALGAALLALRGLESA
jgi:hypothetical protein